jgi:hypothetical protein
MIALAPELWLLIFACLEEPTDIFAAQVLHPVLVELSQPSLAKWFLEKLQDTRIVTFRRQINRRDPRSPSSRGLATEEASPTLKCPKQYEEFQHPSRFTLDSDIKVINGESYDNRQSISYQDNINAYDLMKAISLLEGITISPPINRGWKLQGPLMSTAPVAYPTQRTQFLADTAVVREWQWIEMIGG